MSLPLYFSPGPHVLVDHSEDVSDITDPTSLQRDQETNKSDLLNELVIMQGKTISCS